MSTNQKQKWMVCTVSKIKWDTDGEKVEGLPKKAKVFLLDADLQSRWGDNLTIGNIIIEAGETLTRENDYCVKDFTLDSIKLNVMA